MAVSVVIPAFNAERFLPDAVASVAAQTHAPAEVLIVDDGSTDGTRRVANRLAVQYPTVRVLEHPDGANHGLPATRNVGIRAARGRFVAFLDADDEWLPRKLERQLGQVGSHPAATVLAAPSIYWFSWTGRPRDETLDHIRRLPDPLNVTRNPPELLIELLRSGAAPTMGSLLVRSDVFDRIGLFEDAIPSMYEDQAWLAKAMLVEPFYIGSEPADRYRQHPDSITARAGQSRADLYPGRTPDRLRFLNWLDAYVAAQPEVHPGVRDALSETLDEYQRSVFRTGPGELARGAVWRAIPTPARRAVWRTVQRVRARTRRR